MSLRTRVLSVLVGTVLFFVALPRASEAVHLILREAAIDEGADLLVTKTGPSSAAANTDVSFNVVVFNAGPDDATNVTLTDAVPAGMTFVSGVQNNVSPAFNCLPYPVVGSAGTITCTTPTLPAGASGDFTFVMHIDSETPPGTTFTNIAVVTSAVDPNDENNSSAASVMTPGVDQADLNVTKTGPPNAGPNTDVTFMITVGNSGPNNAQNVTLSDTLPGNMTFVSLSQNQGPEFLCTFPAAGSGGEVECAMRNRR